MPDELTRRPTFGGPPRDDWTILFREVGIGRIYRVQPGLPGPPWIWEIAVLAHRGLRRGACHSFEEARGAFQTSWDQLRASVHDAELQSDLDARRATGERLEALAKLRGRSP